MTGSGDIRAGYAAILKAVLQKRKCPLSRMFWVSCRTAYGGDEAACFIDQLLDTNLHDMILCAMVGNFDQAELGSY